MGLHCALLPSTSVRQSTTISRAEDMVTAYSASLASDRPVRLPALGGHGVHR
jgi:hypothetical protein